MNDRIYFLIFVFIVACYALYKSIRAIKTGKISLYERFKPNYIIVKNDRPVTFWMNLIVYMTIEILVIIGCIVMTVILLK